MHDILFSICKSFSLSLVLFSVSYGLQKKAFEAKYQLWYLLWMKLVSRSYVYFVS